MSLSEVFKFTQGLGQKGHQIGRKVGDAIELLTLGMLDIDDHLRDYLKIEDGIEGATSAKHKVEFSFYNSIDEELSDKSEDLFGIIECKKVGVEQTIKQSFKKWRSKSENKQNFYDTDGYKFGISPRGKSFRWKINVKSIESNTGNLEIQVNYLDSDDEENNYSNSQIFACFKDDQVLITLDNGLQLDVLGNGSLLAEISKPIDRCIIITTTEVTNNKIEKIYVKEALAGPQTPEKAKQASFVSLDTRKKVLGRFDKTNDKSFISILVIGEFSHWERKSRSMIKLCNDYNLYIPDEIIISLFNEFGNNYQSKITKTSYKSNPATKSLVSELIKKYNYKILKDIESGDYVKFKYSNVEGNNYLSIKSFN